MSEHSEYSRISGDSAGYAGVEQMREALQLAHEALSAVEWQPIHAGRVILGYGCVWCGGDKGLGHSRDCDRQLALDAIRSVTT